MTALGGVIVAATGLITALYTTGVIGSKADVNAAPTADTARAFVAAPNAAPSVDEENDFSRKLTGKWEVDEESSLYFSGGEQFTWHYEAVLSGSVLTLTGTVSAVDGDRNSAPDYESVRATYVVTLTGLSGIGVYTVKDGPRRTTSYPDSMIRFDENLKRFVLKVEDDGKTYSLTGVKM